MASTRNIRGISIEIGGDTTKLENSLKTVYQKSTDLTRELRSVDRALKFNPKNVELTSQKQKVLTEQVDNTRKRLNELKSAQAEVTRQYEAGEIDAGQYRAFQRELVETESILKTYEKQLSEVNDTHKIVGKSVQDVGEKMQKTGKKLQEIGKNLTLKVTAPIVAFGGAGIKAASDFESAFAGVKKTVDEVYDANGNLVVSYDDLEKGIRDMAKEIPASTTEISAVAEAAGQLGIETENVLGFTKVMIDMGEATNLSSEEAASSLAQLANITQMPQTEFSNLASAVVQLGNNFATTESDIVAMGLRLAGTSSQVGMSEDEMLALATAMSSVGINAEAGGSSMSRVMQKMNSDVKSGEGNLAAFAEVSGMSAEEFQKSWEEDAAGTIVEFVNGLDEINQSGGDVAGALKEMGISSTQEIDTLLRLSGAGDTLTEALEQSAQGWNENTALSEEAGVRYETLEAKLAVLKNQVVDLAIEYGGPLMDAFSSALEVLQPMIEKVADLATKFSEASPETQKMIIMAGGLLAALGPVISIVGTVTSGFGKMVEGGGKVISNWDKIKGIGSLLAGGLKATVGFIFSPAGAILIGIAAVIAGGVLLWKNWDLVKEKAGELWVGIKESWNSIKESTSETWNNMKEGTSDSWNNMKESISTKAEEIKSNISGKFDEADLNTALSFSNIGRTISEKLSESDSVVLQKAGSIAGNITDNFDHAYSETGKLFPAIKDTISTTLREANLTVATKMSDIGRSISDNLTDSDNVVMQKAGSILRNITNNFDEAYSETGNSFKAIKMTVSNTMKEAATSAVTKVVEMKNDFTVKFNEIKSNTVTAWNNIKDGIMNPINKAKDAVKTAVDQMKGFFNFEWKLPSIKMPKFSVSGSANPLNWLKEGVPKLNVSWNAEGGILTRPGIFGMMGNTLLAGGEHRTGGEAILPLNRLPKLMADAMEMANRTQRQPMPETVQRNNERPEVNVYQEIHSPKELDARESQRLARINMQQLAYQLGGV